MSILSKNVKNILATVGKDRIVDVTPVPKSMGSIFVGDLIIFTYRPEDRKKYYMGQKLAVVVKPVIRDGRSGNLLLTVAKVALTGSLSPATLEDLYKDVANTETDSYRTYILSKVLGNIYKVDTRDREE